MAPSASRLQAKPSQITRRRGSDAVDLGEGRPPGGRSGKITRPAGKTRPEISTSLTAMMFETTSAVTKNAARTTKPPEYLIRSLQRLVDLLVGDRERGCRAHEAPILSRRDDDHTHRAHAAASPAFARRRPAPCQPSASKRSPPLHTLEERGTRSARRAPPQASGCPCACACRRPRGRLPRSRVRGDMRQAEIGSPPPSALPQVTMSASEPLRHIAPVRRDRCRSRRRSTSAPASSHRARSVSGKPLGGTSALRVLHGLDDHAARVRR